MSGTQARLAVMGAGPKAAALAVRVAAIREWQSRGHRVGGVNPNTLRPAPRLDIFEASDRIGAHWDGQGAEGYTDGLQAVCTDPDRDLVYPANHGSFGRALSLTLNGFTWRTYAAASGRLLTTPPSHREFADYVVWAMHEARHLAPNNIFLHTNSEVRGLHLHRSGPHWEVVTVHGRAGVFDGVIVTSPGGAFQRLDVEPTVSSWALNGQNYWTQQTRQQVLAEVARGRRVAIVGAGGAAAAICLDILSSPGATTPNAGGVVLIAPQASLFTRGESTFETELLTSPSWHRLPREARRQIAERLVSGVVFARVLDALEAIGYAPEFLVGRALAATDGAHSQRSSRIELWCLTLDERLQIVEADWVIDASGFDPLWFVGLLDEPAVPSAGGRPRLQRLLGRLGASVLSEKLDEHLRLHVEVELFEADGGTPDEPLLPVDPGLHVPFLAGGSRPPGISSLLQLGVLAEQILLPYLH